MTANDAWSEHDIPDQTGRVVVVTGANSGLGYETARALAERGATVVMACRSGGRAADAVDRIRAVRADAAVEALPLDLASLASVRDFAKAFQERHDRLDVLCNNAGVMALPLRRTADGFEMQLGTNHLGHFALTGLLLPRLLATDGARVVTVSSTMHRIGRMRWDDLQSERLYLRWPAYGQSKLANLLFTFELQRRLESAGASAVALASHPGYAGTNLQTAAAEMEGWKSMARFMELANRGFSQDAASGALPSLYAATAPEARGGEYYGPSRMFEMWGPPKRVGSTARSRNQADARRLWQVSEELTGVRFDALAA